MRWCNIARRSSLKIGLAPGLREIKNDLRSRLREHRTLALRELESAADNIYVEAFSKVPVLQETYATKRAGLESGLLQDSIQVTVSKSPRYPGIVATATARDPRSGYDYALIQEVNEDYEHPNGGQAHYLEEPFREAVSEFYKRMGWE